MRRALSFAILVGAAGAVAGCTSAPEARTPLSPPPVAAAPVGGPAPANAPSLALGQGAGACNAGAAQSLVGQLANVEANEQAKAATGAETVRVIYPNQPLTQEFVPTRLDLVTDQRNRITQVRCG